MESTNDSSTGQQQPNLPPGFRFHPTDEELMVHYLKKKAISAPLPVDIIADVDLYKFDPWELPGKASFGEQEWYFFSPRERKYPNGARPNRAAASGYWKATGTDKPVFSSSSSGSNQKLGVKKTLVFYKGRPPKGIKTNWIMHEYRLLDPNSNNNKPPPGFYFGNKKNSLRLDDWVLCRIYKKNYNSQRPTYHDQEDDWDLTADTTFGQIHQPFIRVGQNQHNLNNLIENDDNNLLQGVINSNININAVSGQLAGNASNGDVGEHFPVKRSFSSMFWPSMGLEAGPGWRRRLELDNSHDGSCVGRSDEGNGSISTISLIGQFPQTLPLQRETMLEAVGDGVFWPPYQPSGSYKHNFMDGPDGSKNMLEYDR